MYRSSNNLLILAFPWMILGIIVMALIGVDVLSTFTVVVFFALCLACFKDISTNIFFMCFLLSFFVFLISGDLAEQIFQRKYWLQFGEAANVHSRICILISLIFLFLGFIFSRRNSHIKISFGGHKSHNEYYISKIRSASRIVYLLTYSVLLFDTLNKVAFVAIGGYISYYTSYISLLPTVIVKIGDFAPIALVVFLATFPSKKECRTPLVLYMVYAIALLLMGQRGGLIYNFIFVFGYLFYRNKHDENGEVWVSKKIVGLLIASIPVVLVLLQIYEYVRSGLDIQFESFGDSIVDFFVNIGSSSKVIKAGYVYQDEIPKGNFYSLGTTLNYFKFSSLFNFSSSEIPAAHTAAYALEGHRFDDMISYLYMRTQYLNGHGAGSSFIAELYADFGYIGVAVGSYLYGVLFKKISNLDKKNWLATAVKILMFMYTIKAPRGSFDGFLSCIINLKHIAVLLIIVLMANTFSYRSPGVKLGKAGKSGIGA